MQKFSLPQGFDARTVKPVASRYTIELCRPTTKSQKGNSRFLVSKSQEYSEYVLSAKYKSPQRYLFNDAASNEDFSATNDGMTLNNELKGMCKEVDMV